MTTPSKICRRSGWIGLGALASLLLAPPPALAQGKFPSRVIRIVSPFAAGSVSDLSMRLFTDRLAARVNGQVVVDNQPRERSETDPDRKSTRLNSSHLGISYAVFCL